MNAVLGQIMSVALQVQRAGAKVIVAKIPDFGDTPFVRRGSAVPKYPLHPDPVKRQLVTAAVIAANEQRALFPRVPFFSARTRVGRSRALRSGVAGAAGDGPAAIGRARRVAWTAPSIVPGSAVTGRCRRPEGHGRRVGSPGFPGPVAFQ